MEEESIMSLPPREPDAYKGDFGRVLVVGGSRGMVGAPVLAAMAALRGGAGLVTMAAPDVIQLAAATLCPCATSIPLACDGSGELAESAVEQIAEAVVSCDVLAVGPGLGVGPVQAAIVALALGQTQPVVLDADGLNNLAQMDDWPALPRCPLVLTPHPGEFARLTGESVEQIQTDRQTAAASAVEGWSGDADDVVCVLKGAGTVVTDGRRVYVNETGNPGMATGGSGDVLTGLIAALIGQDLPGFDAACLGAWAHGRAGDLAVEELGQTSLIATDLLDCLPAALAELAG